MRVSRGGGGRVKKEENTVYLQAVSSLHSCPAWSWHLCLESMFTLVGPWVVSDAGGNSQILPGHPTQHAKDWSCWIVMLGLFSDNALGLPCSLSLGDQGVKQSIIKKNNNCKPPQSRAICPCSKNQVTCVPLESASSVHCSWWCLSYMRCRAGRVGEKHPMVV